MKYDPDAQPAINRAVSRLRREIDDVEQENKTWYYVSPIASQGYILRNARPWNRGH
jgi:hypothetical protein